MRWLPRTPLLLLLATLLHAGAAAAQAPAGAAGTPSQDVVKKADALFQDGNRLVAQQKWAEAEAKFQQAYALNPSFDIATNLGHTQARLGKHRQAAENLAFALRTWPVIGQMAPNRAIAVKQLDEIRPFLAELSVSVNLPDAAILVDGRRAGTSPMKETIFLDPGPHTIEAKLTGHEGGTQKIEAAKGSKPSVSLTLKPSAAPNAVTKPANTEPPTTAHGGVKEPKQPAVNSEPIATQPEVKPQPVAPQTPPNGSKSPVRAILIGTGAATSAVLIGTGIGFAVASANKGAEADSLLTSIEKLNGPAPCHAPAVPAASCKEVFATLKDQSRFADVAAWTFIAGGVVGGATLVYALVIPKRSSTGAVRVVPVMGAGTAGLVMHGQW